MASPVGGRFGDWSGIPVVQERRRWGSIVVCTLSIVGLLMGLVVLLMVERLSLTFSGRRLADMGRPQRDSTDPSSSRPIRSSRETG